MKGFFKNVLATIVGVLISSIFLGIISFVLFFGIIGLLASSSSSDFKLKENTILAINLNGVMKDRVVENPFLEFIGYSDTKEIALTDILTAIEKAKDNKDISGIYIYSGYFSASSASLKEIRDKLNDFKESGKFVIAYADDYLQGGYFLSSVADKIIMNPQGTLDLHGISVDRTFYKGLLDKVGIEMQIFKVGTYKSAVEPYMTDKMSDANREQVTSFANDMWASVITEISNSRDIPVDKLNQIADSLSAFKEASYILENHLVDTLLYATEARQYLKDRLGIAESEKINMASVLDMVSVPDTKKSKSKEEIAILYAEGSIVSGSSNTDINDRYLIRQIEKLKKNEKVKSVVFRVNSPGGSAYASEQIWKAISDLKEKKPVVVSMGDYAASGGYYISCNASKIIAQPNTLTGSIGIFGMFPNVSGLTNKLGLSFDNVKTNKMSDFGDFTRPMNAEEKAILQKYIERGYDLFLTRCSEGRGISKDSLNNIAQGRVWTGTQALDLGLVDALGGIKEALNEAASLAGIEDYSVSEYPKLPSPFEMFFNIKKEDVAVQAMKDYLGDDFNLLKTIREIKNLREQDFMQARMPYELRLK